jgi:hypothetical protein
MRSLTRAAIRQTGTRFRLFPQSPVLEAYRNPETVWVSPKPGTIGPGPSDDRMRVIDALDKQPYEYPYLPPYTGVAHPPVSPDAGGHFDYLLVDDPGFRAAHMYGTVRRALDIWESYFGQRIVWHFSRLLPRLELVPYVDWENAQSGFGFLETGYETDEQGRRELLCLNFDVLAHEMGHLIIFSVVGTPALGAETAEYFGFHESAGDLTALIAVLCFNLVADHVLRQTAGNLYNLSELSRIGEISQTTQIRIADNTLKMSDVAGADSPAEISCQPERHKLAQPLTGAIFDILVDIYQQTLFERGLISASLDRASGRVSGETVDDPVIDVMFAAAYRGRHEAFKRALQDTGDYLGTLLAWTWRRLSPNCLRYEDVLELLLSADTYLTGGAYRDTIMACFVWREIGVERTGRGRRRSAVGRGARPSRPLARR